MLLPEEKFSDDALGWLDFIKCAIKKQWPQHHIHWKYGVPFWQIDGKDVCYFNANKKEVYLSFMYPNNDLMRFLDGDGKKMTAKFYLSGQGKLNLEVLESILRMAWYQYGPE